MNNDELNRILALHKQWILSNGTEGVKANLSGANFSEAYLARANLSEANLNERTFPAKGLNDSL